MSKTKKIEFDMGNNEMVVYMRVPAHQTFKKHPVDGISCKKGEIVEFVLGCKFKEILKNKKLSKKVIDKKIVDISQRTLRAVLRRYFYDKYYIKDKKFINKMPNLN